MIILNTWKKDNSGKQVFSWTFDILTENMQTSLTEVDIVPNSRFEIYIVKPITFLSSFMFCASNMVFTSMFKLHIVNSLVIIEFSLAGKTSKLSLTHEILYSKYKFFFKLNCIFTSYYLLWQKGMQILFC